MKPNATGLALLALLLLCGLGWWLNQKRAPVSPAQTTQSPDAIDAASEPLPTADDSLPVATSVSPTDAAEVVEPVIDIPVGAIGNTLTLQVGDVAAAEALLAANGIDVLDTIPQLGRLRVRLTPQTALRLQALFGEPLPVGFSYPVQQPEPVMGEPGNPNTFGNVPFGDTWRDFIGMPDVVEGTPSVIVAMIDGPLTGTGGPTHAATVDALIGGAQVVPYNVFDGGQSDSFQVAKAIVAATDSGAAIINLSLGTYGDSAELKSAVDYAAAQGVVLVAAAGNDAANRPLKPAAYDEVIGVTAIDAANLPASFNNFGEGVDIAAPGFGLSVNDAGPTHDTSEWVFGTSFATPIVSDSLSRLMRAKSITANEAAEHLLANTNEAGAPGFDAVTGAGTLNLGRALSAGQPTPADLTIASHHLSPELSNASTATILVLVENTGSTIAERVHLQVRYEGRTQTLSLGDIGGHSVMVHEVFLTRHFVEDGITLSSAVVSATEEASLDNNVRSSLFYLSEP